MCTHVYIRCIKYNYKIYNIDPVFLIEAQNNHKVIKRIFNIWKYRETIRKCGDS